MKDPAIVAVVEQLRTRLGANTFAVTDHWEADMCAIGLSNPDEPERLVYICTFAMLPGRYDVALERPPDADSKRFDIDFETLALLVAQHLGT